MCLLIAVPSIIIDASILFTNSSLIPLRFPFSSIFPILGCMLGFCAITRRFRILAALIIGFIAFSFFSFKSIIPRIVFSMEEIPTSTVDPAFLSSTYLNEHGDPINLNALSSRCMLIDLFFVGCGPCELKEKMFAEVISERKENDYRIILICNGSITSFKSFSAYVKDKPKDPRMIYLYDANANIKKYLKDVNGYPHEIVFSNGNPVKSFLGFNIQSFNINKEERIRIIENSQETGPVLDLRSNVNQVKNKSLIIKNLGKKDLVIENFTTTCECTLLKMEKGIKIKYNDSLIVPIIIDKSPSDSSSKIVYISIRTNTKPAISTISFLN